MSKFKFMHESKSIFAIEQKDIVSCFVKDVALLLGHPVYIKDMEVIVFITYLEENLYLLKIIKDLKCFS